MSAFRFYLCALVLVPTFAVCANNPVLERSTPTGVQLGMSPSALLETRPEAKDAGLTSKDGIQQFVEIVSVNGGRIAYWYRFKNETLGALTKSIMASKTPVEQVRESVNVMQAELQGSFNLIGSDQIIRSTGSQSELLTAQHWKEKAGALELYFVASNQEITLVFFDPKYFSKKDFFLGPERLTDVQANEKSVRALIKEMKPDPTKPEPVPLADLLARKSTDSKPSTTSIPPTQASPVPATASPVQQPKSVTSPSPVVQADPSRSSPWPWIIGVILLVAVVVVILLKLRRK